MNPSVPPRAAPVVFLYSKPNCPLCDEALEVLEQAARRTPLEIREVSILSDPELYARYRHHIPVGVLEGREIFRFRTTIDAVLAAVRGRS